jgi:hypothetical protein
MESEPLAANFARRSLTHEQPDFRASSGVRFGVSCKMAAAYNAPMGQRTGPRAICKG